MPELLAPTASRIERAFDAAAAARLDLALPMIDRLRPDAASPLALEALAWAVSVDLWDPAWPEDARRAAARESIEIHRRKGTPGAVKRLMAAIGFPVLAIIEGAEPIYHDGEHLHDGSQAYAPPLDADAPPLIFFDGAHDHDGGSAYGRPLYWATYRIVIDRPMTLAQAARARALLASVAPARCHLVELRFEEVAFIHDGTLTHGGAVSHGAA